MATETLPKISVIVVSYNSAAHLRPTLAALLSQDYPDFEAILVDNASWDGSLAVAREFETRGLRIVANDTNRGFSGGNNDGVSVSGGGIVFLLNPDAEMLPGCLREVAAAFSAFPSAGILGAKLLAPDGKTLLHCGGTIGAAAHCSHLGRGETDIAKWDESREVEYVSGAALALRRSLWDQLGGFDEEFNPAYYEDTDLCLRCRAAGRKVIYCHSICLLHHENVSTEYRSPAFWRMHQRNRVWFILKNFPFIRILFRTLPYEIWWLCTFHSGEVRHMMPRIYVDGFKRLLKHRLCRRRGKLGISSSLK
jgi:GT2 family glycosyltransferase